MDTPTNIDRKTFLTSTLAWAALTLSGCNNDDGGGDNGGAGAGGGAGLGGGAGVSGSSGGAGASAGGTSGSGAGAGGTSGSGAGGAGAGGTSGSGAGLPSAAGGTSGAGVGGDATGGMGGTGMSAWMCETVVAMVNSHTHAVTVPGIDIELGYQEMPYVLEDGGTGHTHTISLTGYDFAYLSAGMTVMTTSTMDASHEHGCNVSCTMG